MNYKCTRKEFEDIVSKKYGHYMFHLEYLTRGTLNGTVSVLAVYAYDPALGKHFLGVTDPKDMEFYSTFIWLDGEVVKDFTNIFPTPMSPPTGTAYASTPSGWTTYNPKAAGVGNTGQFVTGGGTWTVPTGGAYNVGQGTVSLPSGMTVDLKELERLSKPKTKVCECGKEKHGFASHATWCDFAGDNYNV